MKLMAKLRIKDSSDDHIDYSNVQVSNSQSKGETTNSFEKEHPDKLYLECTKYIKQNGVWSRNIVIEWSLISVPLILFASAGLLLNYFSMPILATIVLSICHTLTGWKSHDICHEPWRRDSWLRTVYSAMMGGFSSNWWSKKHNAYHHCYPNMIDVDEDFETSPILMHTTSDKWFHKFQHIYHWVPFSFLKLSWRIQSIPFASVAELVCFIAHYYIGIYVFGAKLFFISILIDGEIAAMITTLNHDAEVKTISPGNFLQQTLRTTIDIDVPWGIGWIFGNMQYQTLHHLFPYIPSYRYESLVPVIKKFCQNNGLQYRTVSMWDAYKNHKKYYYDVVRKPVIGSILQESCYENNIIRNKKIL